MTLLKFYLAPHTLQFTTGSEYPADFKDGIIQVIDRTAGGTLKVEGYGVRVEQKTLVFSLLPAADYHALVDWFYNIAEGAMNKFEMTDEYGVVKIVRIVSPELVFKEVFLNTYSGSVQIEVFS